jgi:hypothetical protein
LGELAQMHGLGDFFKALFTPPPPPGSGVAALHQISTSDQRIKKARSLYSLSLFAGCWLPGALKKKETFYFFEFLCEILLLFLWCF